MKKAYISKPISLLLILFQLTGCSTIFGRHHDDQTVNFDSNVQGVEVICSGKRAMTPGSMPLRQSKSHSCTAQAEGYEKKIFRIKSGMSWAGFGHSTATNTALWGWWTLGIGTAIGWVVDLISGGMRNLKEEDFYIEMRPTGTTSTSEKIIRKTVAVGRAVVELPIEVVRDTAGVIVGTTVEGTAEQIGIPEDPTEQKEPEQQKKEPKKI